ncbi:hypothetical protein [Nonomuraea angiospora]
MPLSHRIVQTDGGGSPDAGRAEDPAVTGLAHPARLRGVRLAIEAALGALTERIAPGYRGGAEDIR